MKSPPSPEFAESASSRITLYLDVETLREQRTLLRGLAVSKKLTDRQRILLVDLIGKIAALQGALKPPTREGRDLGHDRGQSI